jgi:hypothetical protein
MNTRLLTDDIKKKGLRRPAEETQDPNTVKLTAIQNKAQHKNQASIERSNSQEMTKEWTATEKRPKKTNATSCSIHEMCATATPFSLWKRWTPQNSLQTIGTWHIQHPMFHAKNNRNHKTKSILATPNSNNIKAKQQPKQQRESAQCLCQSLASVQRLTNALDRASS